jgi:hypothetical protein
VPKIGLQAPWQLAITPNDRIVPDRRNKNDFHGAVLPHVGQKRPDTRGELSFEKSGSRCEKRHGIVL